MKVAILSTATSYSGGAIITLLNTMPYLQSKGIEPHFILKGHGPLEDLLKANGTAYTVIKSYDWCLPAVKTKGFKNRMVWIVKSALNVLAEFKTAFALLKIRPDIYHLNCIYNGTGVRAAKMLRIPVIWHLREFVDIAGETTMFMNSHHAWKVINMADRIISVSSYLENAYRDKIKDTGKLRIAYDGIDMSRFTAPSKPHNPGEKIVIGLAGTTEIKNHKDAILALAHLKKEGLLNFVLQIAGRWSKDAYNQQYLDGLKQLIFSNDLEDNVEFVGMQEDMNAFWKSCDLSLVCSKRESFGLAATESMACRTPLICSHTSLSGELTNSGMNVSVYKTGDDRDLAEQIKRNIALLGSAEMESRILRADRFVRKTFSIENSAEALFAIYTGVHAVSTENAQ